MNSRPIRTRLLGAAVSGAASTVRAGDDLLPPLTSPVPPSATNVAAEILQAGPGPSSLSEGEHPRREERFRWQEEEVARAWTELSLDDKQRALEWYRGVRQLPLLEQRSLRESVERYLRMSPEEKQQLEKNCERWAQMTKAERERARLEFLRLRWEYERKWRKEHPDQPPPPFHLPQPTPAPLAKQPEKGKTAEKPAPVEADKPASAKTNG